MDEQVEPWLSSKGEKEATRHDAVACVVIGKVEEREQEIRFDCG